VWWQRRGSKGEHLDLRAATCPFSCRFPHHSPLVSHSDPAPVSPHTASNPPSLIMPTCRRKRVVLTEPPEALLQALKSDPTRQVFYLEQTGEIFETFECVLFHPHSRSRLPTSTIRAYAARMSFYRLKQFQCEVTGKSGLDYFQAVESERQEAKTMHARFPEPLKPAVLKAVQWRTFL